MKSYLELDWKKPSEMTLRHLNYYFGVLSGRVVLLQYFYEEGGKNYPDLVKPAHHWFRNDDFYREPELVAELRTPALPAPKGRSMAFARPLKVYMQEGKVTSCSCPYCDEHTEIHPHLFEGVKAKRIKCRSCKGSFDVQLHASYEERERPKLNNYEWK